MSAETPFGSGRLQCLCGRNLPEHVYCFKVQIDNISHEPVPQFHLYLRLLLLVLDRELLH
jgi:hypothetical protein